MAKSLNLPEKLGVFSLTLIGETLAAVGVLFHFWCANWCAIDLSKIFIIGLVKKERYSGIVVPTSRTATTCGNNCDNLWQNYLVSKISII